MHTNLPCISASRPGIGAMLSANGVAASEHNIDAISALIYIAHLTGLAATRKKVCTTGLEKFARLLHTTASMRPIPAEAIYELQLETLICTAMHKIKFAVPTLRTSAAPVYNMGGH
ncbi:hypothetical protein [Rivihabitans pingtungensis]|uniref:hypothetical protein n=1 Tax=Rivihabitans pingtungensis TaxID=1054498 RepID=UPI002355FFFD|nr:hypothetical protein [Rivihabitans pingtungensis]MCK6435991.1 hypothetical protein [Rivihabitans pingtungensis]